MFRYRDDWTRLHHGVPWQPGLGLFGCLPPEVRNIVWSYCLQSVAPVDYCVYEKDPGTIPITQLMITYASRHLYNEITGIYLGEPRDLTVCVGLSDYNLARERHEGKYTNYHLNFNGVIRCRDLAYTNFAFFRCINLHLQLPVNGPATRADRFRTLKFFVAEFSETVQDWQSRQPWWSIARCPPIHVLADIPKERDSLLS